MPLSPSDVQFLNKLLDKHLKNQRSWPTGHYVSLRAGAFMIVVGCIMLWMISSFPQLDLITATTHHANASATQPVTRDMFFEFLQTNEQLAQGYARMEATLASARLFFTIFAIASIIMGFQTSLVTLTHWNRHRRDTILITLLREKCAADLSMSASPIAPTR